LVEQGDASNHLSFGIQVSCSAPGSSSDRRQGRCNIMTATRRSAVTWFAVEAGFLSLGRRYADVGVLREEGPQEQGSPPGD
jgi:hypothetical protein